MTSRIRQILISNSSEHRINWNVKLGAKNNNGEFGGQKLLKTIGNMVFLRGDAIYESQNKDVADRLFGYDPSMESFGIYTT